MLLPPLLLLLLLLSLRAAALQELFDAWKDKLAPNRKSDITIVG
jgi:hypothetical protein